MTFNEIMEKSLQELYRFAENSGYDQWCTGEELAQMMRINQEDKLYLVLTEMATNRLIEAEGVDLKHEFIVEKVRIIALGVRVVEDTETKERDSLI